MWFCELYADLAVFWVQVHMIFWTFHLSNIRLCVSPALSFVAIALPCYPWRELVLCLFNNHQHLLMLTFTAWRNQASQGLRSLPMTASMAWECWTVNISSEQHQDFLNMGPSKNWFYHCARCLHPSKDPPPINCLLMWEIPNSFSLTAWPMSLKIFWFPECLRFCLDDYLRSPSVIVWM